MEPSHIHDNIVEYLGNRRADARYASWDYCFNYFHRHAADPRSLCRPDRLEMSCLQLGFYLASWGMYRGSTDLLQRSARHLVAVVHALADAPSAMWALDVDGYRQGGVEMILGFHSTLGKVLTGATITLTTKIMLGVFGCVPAFDTQFRSGFQGATTFSRGSLGRVASFYEEHRAFVDHYRVPTLSFDTGLETETRYTAAKVIDMIFFVEGGRG